MKTSYCATHDTYPKQGSSCWQCVNAEYERGYAQAQRAILARLQEVGRALWELNQELQNEALFTLLGDLVTAIGPLAGQDVTIRSSDSLGEDPWFMERFTCPRCSYNRVSEEATFCSSCGCKLTWELGDATTI